jgi:ribose transport system substrate-binding protein
VLSGCAREPDDGRVSIAQSIPTLADPWYAAFSDGSRDMAAVLNVRLAQVTNPPNTPYDPGAQITVIENLAATEPDVIQVDPTSTDGINGAIKIARQAGIPVVTDGINVSTEVDASVIADNFDGGRQAGDYLASALGPQGGEIAILAGQPGRDIVQQRQDGFKAGLAANPAAQIVAEQVAEQSRKGGQTVMENMLQASPDITAVWSAADTMSMGALEALKGVGKAGQVAVGGFNGDPEAFANIEAGIMSFTIDQVPYEMGASAIAMSYLLATGAELPERDAVLQTRLVTRDNVDDYLTGADALRAATIESVLAKHGLPRNPA